MTVMTKQERGVLEKFAKEDSRFGRAIEKALYRLDQDTITVKALLELPKSVRKFYEAGRREDGTFDWLTCKICKSLRKFGHLSDCPVLDLEPEGVEYKEYKP